MQSGVVTIYVRLLNEGVDVWRPVSALQLRDDVYRILPQHYEREIETWEFEPGDDVACKWIEGQDGRIFAAANKAADGQSE